MTMTKNYKILSKFIKDLSSETPDLETYLFVRDNISKYHLNDIPPHFVIERLSLKLYAMTTISGA